nr:CdaR family protein [Limosilactobacillus coleohominis]
MRIASLILAIFLFMYVNSEKNGFLRQTTRGSDSGNALMSNKTMSIRMPLELKMNSQKYVVTGYPQYVKVRVSGPSAMVTTVSNTQNFKVYADLTKLGIGTHTVTLKESGLNSELRSTIKPQQIKVNIQPRSTVTAPVDVRLNSKSVDGNYHVGTPRPALKTVQITGARNQVKRVARVIAYVDVPRDAHGNFSRQVTLQAVDKKGRTVNVVIMPSSINVEVPVSKQGNNEPTSSSSSSNSASSNSDNDSSSNMESSSSSASSND